jgi:phosphoglycerol transferase MdoB-like AlkP superfamily enzyme
MVEKIILGLLILAVISETLYMIFRDTRLTSINVPVYSAAIILSVFRLTQNLRAFSIISVLSLMLLLSAKIKLRNKPFEKPDYRYLLILTGVLVIHIQ